MEGLGQTFKGASTSLSSFFSRSNSKLRPYSYGRYFAISVAEVETYHSHSPFQTLWTASYSWAKFISDDDPRHIWAWHVHPNEEYNAASQPLYELFRKNDFASLAIIDVDKGETEIVFWDKQYYRRIADDLRRMGFLMGNAPNKTNVLCFRKIESTVRVDITIWWNLYHVRVY